jgi:transcriptional regulator with GAF, ATPase, and Fis domain
MRRSPPSARYWVQGVDSVKFEAVTERLRHLGIDCVPATESGPPGHLLVFLSSVSDEILKELEAMKSSPALCLCVILGDARIASAHVWQLLQAGANDVVTDLDGDAVDQIAARLERWHTVDRLLSSAEVAGTLIGTSTSWQRLLRQVVEVAAFTVAPVLIVGETGTGKDLLARLIHSLDARQGKRELVTVDCTTIVPELSGSELFGHERGAYTGAVAAREGAFALAHKGTLFLDEVGELPVALQAQLLRAVQEHTYKKVGGNTWQQTDFRLVSATNSDLEAGIRNGSFRADLYYRLASWVFRPPPLRERRDDILPLARHFLGSVLSASSDFDPAVADYIESREYSGNVRELQQLVTRMGQRHVGPGPITAGDLPAEEWPTIERAAREQWPDAAFEEAIRRGLASGAELRKISQAACDTAIKLTVQSEQGNLQRASKRLGITDRALQLRKANGQL